MNLQSKTFDSFGKLCWLFALSICVLGLPSMGFAQMEEEDSMPGEVENGDAGSADETPCPEDVADIPCAIDLTTGKVTGPCAEGSGSFYTSIPRVEDSNDDGWLETVVPVNLSDGCSQVCVVLDYGEEPTGWTLNFGDSSTNNGHGGNAGTGESEAELQILNDRLTLYSRAYGPGLTDRVATADVQVTEGAYKVCVRDQFALFGQPRSTAHTPNGKALFALPDPSDGNSDLYIGLNRVIGSVGGPPSSGRVGTGLSRAYITFE